MTWLPPPAVARRWVARRWVARGGAASPGAWCSSWRTRRRAFDARAFGPRVRWCGAVATGASPPRRRRVGSRARGRTRRGRARMRRTRRRRGSRPRGSGPGLPRAGPSFDASCSLAFVNRPFSKCNNDCYAYRAGSGVAGDALVVSRGSAAGASPRRRPELVPRSRAALLKASRGRGVKAARHSQIGQASKYPPISVQPTTRVFVHESLETASRRTTRRTGRSDFVGAMSGLLSLIRRYVRRCRLGTLTRSRSPGIGSFARPTPDEKT